MRSASWARQSAWTLGAANAPPRPPASSGGRASTGVACQVVRNPLEQPRGRRPKTTLRLGSPHPGRVSAHPCDALPPAARPEDRERVSHLPCHAGAAAIQLAGRRRGPAFDLLAVPRGERGGCGGEGERRSTTDLLGRELGEPAAHLLVVALRDAAGGLGPQQAGCRIDVARCDRVANRFVSVAASPVPRGRAPVQLGLQRGLRAPQLRAQQLAEQTVVAIGLAASVQAHQHRVRAREIRQRRPGDLTVQHGVAGRLRQGVQHRGAHEERGLGGAQRREQLVAQIVRDEPVVPGEALHGGVNIGLGPYRQGGEVEAGGPALGDADERVEVLLREPQIDPLQERFSLHGLHREIVRAQLEELPVCPQAPHRQPRLATQRRPRAETRPASSRRPPGGGSVRPRREARGRRPTRALLDAECGRHPASEPGCSPMLRAGADPAEWTRIVRRPLGEQRRLSVARGRDEECDRDIARLHEPAEQPRPGHQAGRARGRGHTSLGSTWVAAGDRQLRPATAVAMRAVMSNPADTGRTPRKASKPGQSSLGKDPGRTPPATSGARLSMFVWASTPSGGGLRTPGIQRTGPAAPARPGVLQLHQALAHGPERGLRARAQPELSQQVRHVRPRCRSLISSSARDLLVGLAAPTSARTSSSRAVSAPTAARRPPSERRHQPPRDGRVDPERAPCAALMAATTSPASASFRR